MNIYLAISGSSIATILLLLLIVVAVIFSIHDRNKYHADESDAEEAENALKNILQHAKDSFKNK